MRAKVGKKIDENEELSRALSRYEKQFQSLPYKELPLDLSLDERQWNLSQWTLVVSDTCLSRISHQCDGTAVCSLDLTGASKVTDVGVVALSDALPNLSTLLLENIFRLTSKGLARIVKCCSGIRHLSLSGCLGISGEGFAILGQHSRELVTLKLSGCRQISPWSFMKIFEGCILLEELDTSYCSLITDQEVKILANCCNQLRRVNLKECRQVSDIGILSLAQRCEHLTSINLARSDLVARITDVSLMAIGEGCKYLQSINLSGCSKLTDAGISWLTKGCNRLNYINLSKCTSITNGGIRYIGDECTELKSLILINVKKVSDIGIRYLAEGCSKLESLNVSGLYMISDGVQRDFAHEGIQSLGGAKCAKSMKKVNLHGCFQMSNWALKALSAMTNLEHLVLSGCTKITLTGLSAVVKSCHNISFLSFASCGDCITNEIVEEMSKYLHNLKSLILSECGKISRKALVGISRFKKLRHLNLSGCKGVTNEAILALCDGNYTPGIRELYIDRCHHLDDNSLMWIVDSLHSASDKGKGYVSLTTLSMKGTKISLSSAKAIRERFRYSSLKVNASFFGFWALSRTEDRIAINLHNNSAESAARIQATIRGHKGRVVVAKTRQHYSMMKNATLVAAIWRGRAARKFVKDCRHTSWLRKVAAIKLQCFFRYFLAKNIVQRMRDKRWMTVAPYAATKIQKLYRGTKGREKALEQKKADKLLTEKRLCCCIKLQAIFRQMLAKNLRGQLKMKKIAFEHKQYLCCIKIQSSWRMRAAIMTLKELKLSRQKQLEKEFNAVCCLSRSVRIMQFRHKIEERVQHTNMLNSMAIKIQVCYRDRVSFAKFKAEEKNRHEILRQESAIRIEKTWRRKDAFMIAKILRKNRAALEKLKSEKAFVLTSWSRVCLAKRQLYVLRDKRTEELKLRLKVETEAATQIESCWRGHKGRSEAREVLRTKKSRWKQLWSENDGRHYFYNQITGESRWRMPQDLLDLESKIICNNCEYYEAKLECASCKEYYCGSCWDAVHFGGKRKSHAFRSLYDFYGKRVDYGDTEFPSKWPSEIEQDDILGWQSKMEIS